MYWVQYWCLCTEEQWKLGWQLGWQTGTTPIFDFMAACRTALAIRPSKGYARVIDYQGNVVYEC